MSDFGIRAKVKASVANSGVSLDAVTYGSYVRVLRGGALVGEICIWTYSSELIPLSAPGKLETYREQTHALRSSDIDVEILPEGSVISLTIENNKAVKET